MSTDRKIITVIFAAVSLLAALCTILALRPIPEPPAELPALVVPKPVPEAAPKTPKTPKTLPAAPKKQGSAYVNGRKIW